MSDWFTIYRCKSCDVCIPWSIKMQSFGTCPKCGKNSGDSIVDTYTDSIRQTSPWWKFWAPTYETLTGEIIK